MIISISHYFLIFIIYSIVGWITEICYCYITTKKLVDRGFLIGPYCPIYGCGSVLIILLLETYKSNILVVFILAMVICMVLEYITSYLMEKLFRARWWDYSEMKFNINGRICLENAVLFGLGALALIYLLDPVISSLFSILSDKNIIIISAVVLTPFLIDLVVSFNVVSKFKNAGFKINKDSTEEITKKIREYLKENSRLTKRLINAFPYVQERINNFRQSKVDK